VDQGERAVSGIERAQSPEPLISAAGRGLAVFAAGRRLVARLRSRGNGRSLLLYASMPALSAVNAMVGLMLPMLLGPQGFGQYSLAVTLFQYGLIFDLGVSQTIDRRIPMLMATAPGELDGFAATALGVRMVIGGLTLGLGGLALAALSRSGNLPFGLLDGLLSLSAGLAFMVVLGPMSVWRAQSRRSAFASSSALTGLALAVARPLGVVLAGITGSFAALLACYAALAVVLPGRYGAPAPTLPRAGPALRLVGAGLPLFITSILWAVYMTANRWVVSFLATPVELGHFAFGANVLALVVGMLAMLSQLYYPAIVTRVAAEGRRAVSGTITRDLFKLALVGTALAVAGIAAGPRLIELAYRSFAGSAEPMRILLVALPSLVVCSWLVPLGLATAERPWIEGAFILPVALLVLIGANWAGFRMGGIEGAAWGSSVGGPALLLLQLGAFVVSGLLSLRHAGLVLALVAGASALLALLVAAA